MNLQDFLCGLTAGWTQIILGQPFDFVKVKIQTATNPSSVFSYAKEILNEFGWKGFYRGSSSLFFGFAGTIGTQFLVYQWAKRMLYQRRFTQSPQCFNYDPNKLKLWQIGASGAIVGWVVSFIYCPVQYVKIQKQLSNQIKQSSFGLLLQQAKKNGIKNIYRGYWGTCLRQIYGTVFYYSSYQATVRYYSNKKRQSANSLVFLLAGAVAGLSYHLLTYPIDTFKTNMQAGTAWRQSLKMSLQFNRLKGYKVVLVRAAIVNAGSFFMYQKAQEIAQFLNNPYYTMY